jgi:saccharopine dehydrogenase (NAD+, L-lysine-forming)
MKPHLWLRAETKAREARCALTPDMAGKVLERGFNVTVEQSHQSVFSTHAFRDLGCEVTPPGTWMDAPVDAFILGLKELPENDHALRHRHIYFAHAYKGQQGSEKLLMRFRRGGGTLYDLEYLVDETGRRVAAFGYWAGFSGAAAATLAWAHRLRATPGKFSIQPSYSGKIALLKDVEDVLNACETLPRAIILGAAGRCGHGASDFFAARGIPITAWDIEETRSGGPFDQILDHDIFVNCVYVSKPTPPFISPEMLTERCTLSIICDVSCDPSSKVNPLPIYTQTTTFDQPLLRVAKGSHPIDLIAIDHLPSMLPTESSEDFSRQLCPHLLELDDPDAGVWQGAKLKYEQIVATIT